MTTNECAPVNPDKRNRELHPRRYAGQPARDSSEFGSFGFYHATRPASLFGYAATNAGGRFASAAIVEPGRSANPHVCAVWTSLKLSSKVGAVTWERRLSTGVYTKTQTAQTP